MRIHYRFGRFAAFSHCRINRLASVPEQEPLKARPNAVPLVIQFRKACGQQTRCLINVFLGRRRFGSIARRLTTDKIGFLAGCDFPP